MQRGSVGRLNALGKLVFKQYKTHEELSLWEWVLFVPRNIVMYLSYTVRFQDASVRKLSKKHLITHCDLDPCFSHVSILVPSIKKEPRCPTKQPRRG